MKFTRFALAALLTLGFGAVAPSSATAAPIHTATTCDFWFICC